jgi:hypothetical protein
VAIRFQPPADVLEAYNKARAADSSAGGGEGRTDVAQAGERPANGGTEGVRDTTRRARGMRQGGRGDGARQQGEGGWQQGGGEGRSAAGGMRRAQMATVWVQGEDGKLTRVRIRTGLTDQRYVELIGDRLKEGDKVVLGLNGGGSASGGQRPNSPFQPQMGGPSGGGGAGRRM